MDELQRVSEEAITASKKIRLWTAIIIGPIYICMLLFIPLYGIKFGEAVSQQERTLLTNFEYSLTIPNSVLGYLFLIFWIVYFINYLVSNRNHIKAYIYNGIWGGLLALIAYYQFIVAFQFFVPLLIIRIFYWFLFVLSLIYIFYIIFTDTDFSMSIFQKVDTKILTNALLILWGISAILNLLISGFENLLAKLLLAAFPVAPLIFIFIFTNIYQSLISTLKSLFIINKNQEKYRQEFGYSVKDWYGKKSRAYLEVVGQVKPSFIRTPLFRHTIEIIISLVLLVVIGSVNVNNDSPSLWVIFSIILICVIFPIDYIISLIKWLIMKIKRYCQ